MENQLAIYGVTSITKNEQMEINGGSLLLLLYVAAFLIGVVVGLIAPADISVNQN